MLINIDVDDLDRAAAFYTRLLGVKVGRRFGALGMELVGGSAPIYLLVKDAGTPASPSSADRRRYDRHWTPVHLDFAVPDLDQAVAAALAAGASQEG
ncbi:MAG: VOC family protein, partial [Hyphomicrobiaceae bacterium]|nr:VOC family protein [Hyphomicrobiaceae bacterium]